MLRRLQITTGTGMNKIKTPEMEIVLTEYFTPRINLVVPNVSWGFLPHEADLLVMTKAACLYEVEIKVSLADLKADAKKKHCHESKKIKYLYFAIPEHLLIKGEQYIPARAGILVVKDHQRGWRRGMMKPSPVRRVEQHRAPVQNGTYKLSDKERYQIARLGALRVLGLKKKVMGLKNRGSHLVDFIKKAGLWETYKEGS